LSVTSMLTLIAYQFQLTSVLPRLAYLTTIDKILLGSTVIVFFSLVEATVTVRLVKEGRAAVAQRMDDVCRWMFPAIYLVMWVVVVMTAPD